MPRIKVETIATPPSFPPAPPSTSAPIPAAPQHLETNFPVEPEILRRMSDKLSAFVAMPKKVKFQGEDSQETVILLLRKHVITNVPWVIVAVLLLLSPTVIFPVLIKTNIIPVIPAGLAFTGALFWYMASATYILLNFLYWYFNVYIVTNERVVDVDWYSLIYRRVTTAQMSKIQDVSNTIGGVIRSIFDFGNVHIETAGEMENIEFEDVPHPAIVAKQIEHLMQHEEEQWEERP